MSKLKDAPTKLQPYLFHGVNLVYDNLSEPVADCPFCGKEQKFYVSSSTGQFCCKSASCGAEGNIYGFIRRLHEQSEAETKTGEWLEEFAQERGVSSEFLEEWGVALSVTTGEAIVPGYNVKGSVVNLYQWLPTDKGKRILYATPTLRHGLFGMRQWSSEKEFAIVAEGPWTGSSCREILASCRGELQDGKVVATADRESSLLNNWNVVGVPGCGNFREPWVELFQDKDVMILFDNDYPNEKTNKSPGWQGTLRTARLMLESENPPVSIRGLQWGTKGYDPTLPDGYDLRDPMKEVNGKLGPRLRTACNSLKDVANRLESLDVDKVGKTKAKGSKTVSREPTPAYCESYKEVRNSWRKALKWTDSLDITLSSMLATAGSTGLGGMCPLWLRVIGTPGTAKSTLCEALAVSRKYTYSVSTFTGLHSGARDSEGNTCSLIPDMNGKCVITKDGDTLLNASNKDQLLSQWRDIYEGTSRARYRNTTEAQEYTGLKITYILAGTKSLRRMNRSFLGDRFLDVVVYHRGDDPELEKEILRRSAINALRKLRNEDSNDSSAEERLLEAKEYTAGYLHYLRENMEDLVNEVTFPDERLQDCTALGELIGYMRARPDKEAEDEDDETELATRLTEQLVRLAGCTAVVLNKQSVDEEVMRRVHKLVRDTSRGLTLQIGRILYKYRKGLEVVALRHFLKRSHTNLNNTLGFMEAVGVLSKTKRSRSHVWKLTPQVRDLLKVLEGDNANQQ